MYTEDDPKCLLMFFLQMAVVNWCPEPGEVMLKLKISLGVNRGKLIPNG